MKSCRALREAMAGRTTFVVSSRLSLLRRADLILVLEDGRLTQTGTHDELVHRPGPYHETAAAADDGFMSAPDNSQIAAPAKVAKGDPSARARPSRYYNPTEEREADKAPLQWQTDPADFPLHPALCGEAQLAFHPDLHARRAIARAGVDDRPHHQRADFEPQSDGHLLVCGGLFRPGAVHEWSLSIFASGSRSNWAKRWCTTCGRSCLRN